MESKIITNFRKSVFDTRYTAEVSLLVFPKPYHKAYGMSRLILQVTGVFWCRPPCIYTLPTLPNNTTEQPALQTARGDGDITISHGHVAQMTAMETTWLAWLPWGEIPALGQ